MKKKAATFSHRFEYAVPIKLSWANLGTQAGHAMPSKGRSVVACTVVFKKAGTGYLNKPVNSIPFMVGGNMARREIALYPSRGEIVDRDKKIYANPVYRQDEIDVAEDVSRAMFERIALEDILVVHANTKVVTIVFKSSVGTNLFARLTRSMAVKK
jgi:hypothetical protein